MSKNTVTIYQVTRAYGPNAKPYVASAVATETPKMYKLAKRTDEFGFHAQFSKDEARVHRSATEAVAAATASARRSVEALEQKLAYARDELADLEALAATLES